LSDLKIDIEEQSASISIEEFIELIDGGADIPQVTISRTETRQKAQYSPNQYFLSVQMNFAHIWQMVKSCKDQKKARSLAKKKIHDEVMKKEQWVSSVLLHLQMKDEVAVFPRNPENPALKASTLKEVIELKE
jgi:hypothetical protein